MQCAAVGAFVDHERRGRLIFVARKHSYLPRCRFLTQPARSPMLRAGQGAPVLSACAHRCADGRGTPSCRCRCRCRSYPAAGIRERAPYKRARRFSGHGRAAVWFCMDVLARGRLVTDRRISCDCELLQARRRRKAGIAVCLGQVTAGAAKRQGCRLIQLITCQITHHAPLRHGDKKAPLRHFTSAPAAHGGAEAL